MNSFGIDRPSLQDMLKEIGNGRMQLPDFQRGWVWDDDRIRSLLASLSQSFPMGSVLTLEAGGPDIRFKTRVIEGVDSTNTTDEPNTLILDGQQRLTALYQSLMSQEGVYTLNHRNQKSYRYYYFDIKGCFKDEIDREETVFSYEKGQPLQKSNGEIIDLSSTKAQYDNHMFPVSQIFDAASWRREYHKYWNYNSDKIELFDKFESGIIECFKLYNVPVIHLRKETPREAVCLVFEKVNTTGVTLTIFELLTATFAADNFLLREDWNSRNERLKAYSVLERVDTTTFLRTLSLLATHATPNTAVSCKRKDILKLTLDDYQKWADLVEEGFVKVAHFLHRQKIFSARDLPYPAQLTPLAAILTDLGNAGITEGAQQKIARWYWCSVFGEMYASATDSQSAKDFLDITTWVRSEIDIPTTIREANFHANRLIEVGTRASAVYKGVYALLIAYECRDFLMGKPVELQRFFDENIDIHHIFPRAWCKKEGIEPHIYNSIINKTALSASTNRKIGGDAPSAYLHRTQAEAGIDDPKMDEILTSHFISADALRADNFSVFFEERKEALLAAIEKAMGKKVIRENGEDVPDLFDVDALLEEAPDAQNG